MRDPCKAESNAGQVLFRLLLVEGVNDLAVRTGTKPSQGLRRDDELANAVSKTGERIQDMHKTPEEGGLLGPKVCKCRRYGPFWTRRRHSTRSIVQVDRCDVGFVDEASARPVRIPCVQGMTVSIPGSGNNVVNSLDRVRRASCIA